LDRSDEFGRLAGKRKDTFRLTVAGGRHFFQFVFVKRNKRYLGAGEKGINQYKNEK